jgi:hypothetical protein
VPSEVDKSRTLFFHPRTKHSFVKSLASILSAQHMSAYCGMYAGPADLKEFYALVQIPYQFWVLSQLEGIAYGAIQCVPTLRFFTQELLKSTLCQFLAPETAAYSEWYSPEYEGCLIYFDSWDELFETLRTLDVSVYQEQMRACYQKIRERRLGLWKELFSELET